MESKETLEKVKQIVLEHGFNRNDSLFDVATPDSIRELLKNTKPSEGNRG